MKTLIIFHSPCKDGHCAAWLMGKVTDPDQTLFLPSIYGDEIWTTEQLPEPYQADIADTDVQCVDYSLPVPLIEYLAQHAHSLTIVDHHKTFLQTVEEHQEDWELVCSATEDGDTPARYTSSRTSWNLDIYTHSRRSGAELVFRLNRSALERVLLPVEFDAAALLVAYVGDRDLWNWQLPKSDAFNRYLNVAIPPRDYGPGWDSVMGRLVGGGFRGMVDQGELFRRAEQNVIDGKVRQAHLHDVRTPEGTVYRGVPVLNTTELTSGTGHALLEAFPDAPFALMYFDLSLTTRKWSLRGHKGGVDVSEIAKQFGGGGHPAAAGFETITNQPEFIT